MQVTDVPLSQQIDPSNIISAPIAEQEENKDNQRQTPPLPPMNPSFHISANQTQYIQPWPGYVLRKPSNKLMRSNVYKYSNTDDSQNVESMMTGKSPVTLEKKTPKHSFEAEEILAQPCQSKLTFL